MKASVLAQVLIAGLLLTACGSASSESDDTAASPASDQSSAASGMLKGSLPSGSSESSTDPSTEEMATSEQMDSFAVDKPPIALVCIPAPRAMCDGADLSGQNLSGADLSGISLKGAILVGTNFSSANLTNAQLTGASISNAVWTGADLTSATSDFDALSPALQSAKTCGTRMAKGVIDSRGCPCKNVGGATIGAYPWIGGIGLGAISTIPREFARAEGQLVNIYQRQGLFSLLGNTWGGDGQRTFALPQVTGPWAGVRTGKNGDGKCLQWAVAIEGMYSNTAVTDAFPGEIRLSAVNSSRFRYEMTDAGARIDTTIGAYLGKGFTAYAIPSSWPTPSDNDDRPYLGEIRLFTTAQPLPAPFIPADGAVISESQYPYLGSLLGNSLPLIVAPDGYRWAVATNGIYPQN